MMTEFVNKLSAINSANSTSVFLLKRKEKGIYYKFILVLYFPSSQTLKSKGAVLLAVPRT